MLQDLIKFLLTFLARLIFVLCAGLIHVFIAQGPYICIASLGSVFIIIKGQTQTSNTGPILVLIRCVVPIACRLNCLLV